VFMADGGGPSAGLGNSRDSEAPVSMADGGVHLWWPGPLRKRGSVAASSRVLLYCKVVRPDLAAVREENTTTWPGVCPLRRP
jgi:hypothetical protein